MHTQQQRTRRMLVVIATLAMTIGACGAPAADDGDVVGTGAADQAQNTVAAASTPEPGAATPSESGVDASPTSSSRPTTPPQPVAPTGGPTPTPTPVPIATPELPSGVSEPVRLEIPSIGVDASLVDLSLGNGNPEVPDAWEDAGWYETTRNPGEIGPAVIAGHIDSKTGPAVFYRLRELVHGDEIIVHGAAGDVATFVVQDSGQYPKTSLPNEVFGFGQPRPELRLITCGGSFDSSVGHYVDNLVVYAATV